MNRPHCNSFVKVGKQPFLHKYLVFFSVFIRSKNKNKKIAKSVFIFSLYFKFKPLAIKRVRSIVSMYNVKVQMFSISALKHMVKVAKSQNVFSFSVTLQNITSQNHYPIRL